MNRPPSGPLGRAPNYTNAALLSGLVNLLCLLFALWAIWGWPAVLLAALVLNWLIDRLEATRRR